MFPSPTSILQIEVTVKSFDRDFVILSIEKSDAQISWPRSALPENISIGMKWTLEAKNDPATSIGKIIEAAKMSSEKDTSSMRKLLEQLIN